MMFYIVLFVSFLLAFCGYIVNENNADLLLAGYNTMSEDEKSKFDLVNYLKFFRTFMINVAIYSAIIYFLSTFFFSEDVSAIIYAVSLSVPWPYFLIISNNRFIK